MAKNSIDAYGASGKSNVLFFEPESLHLVTDTTHPLYDERVHLPLNEAVILNIMELGGTRTDYRVEGPGDRENLRGGRSAARKER